MGNEQSSNGVMTSRKTSSSSEQSKITNSITEKNLNFGNLLTNFKNVNTNNFKKNFPTYNYNFKLPTQTNSLFSKKLTKSNISNKLNPDKLMQLANDISKTIPFLLSTHNNIDIVSSGFGVNSMLNLDNNTGVEVSIEVSKSIQSWIEIKDEKLNSFKRILQNFEDQICLVSKNNTKSSTDDGDFLYSNKRNCEFTQFRNSFLKMQKLEEKVNLFYQEVDKLEVNEKEKEKEKEKENEKNKEKLNDSLNMDGDNNYLLSENLKTVKKFRHDLVLQRISKIKIIKNINKNNSNNNSNTHNKSNSPEISKQDIDNKNKMKNIKLDLRLVTQDNKKSQQKSIDNSTSFRNIKNVNKSGNTNTNMSTSIVKDITYRNAISPDKSTVINLKKNVANKTNKINIPIPLNKSNINNSVSKLKEQIKTIIYRPPDKKESNLSSNEKIVNNTDIKNINIKNNFSNQNTEIVERPSISKTSSNAAINNNLNLYGVGWTANKITYAELIKKREDGVKTTSQSPIITPRNSNPYINKKEPISNLNVNEIKLKDIDSIKKELSESILSQAQNITTKTSDNISSKLPINNYDAEKNIKNINININELNIIQKEDKNRSSSKINSSIAENRYTDNSNKNFSNVYQNQMNHIEKDLPLINQDKDKTKEENFSNSLNKSSIAYLNKMKNLKINLNINQLKKINDKENKYKDEIRDKTPSFTGQDSGRNENANKNLAMFRHGHRRSNSFGGFNIESHTNNMYDFNPNPYNTMRESDEIIGEKFSFRNNLRISKENQQANQSDLVQYIKPVIMKKVEEKNYDKEEQSINMSDKNESFQTENSTSKSLKKLIDDKSSKQLTNLNMKGRLIYKKHI